MIGSGILSSNIREQSSRLISEHIAGHCIALDSYLQTKSSESTLNVENNEVTKPFLDFLTDEIPSVLLDNICHATVKILLQPLNGEERRRRNAPSPGLYSAILLLPQSTSRTLDFGSLFFIPAQNREQYKNHITKDLT